LEIIWLQDMEGI